jgi:hypothetical protein
MKIIFLDNDGVICLQNNWGGRSNKKKTWSAENLVSEYDSSMVDESNYPVHVRFDDFDKKAIGVLNEIIEETGAEIVVSSDWKLYATVEELGEYYIDQGISKKPINRTLNMSEFDPDGASLFNWKGWRCRMRIVEIEQYLKDHPEITHWVAVDDMNMSPEANQGHGLFNFVLTPRSNEGIKQSGIKKKIIDHLK